MTRELGLVTLLLPKTPAASVEEICGFSPLWLLANITSRLNWIQFALFSKTDQLGHFFVNSEQISHLL